MVLKKCSKCNEEKEIDQFSKRADSRDGFSYVCKSCRKLSRKTIHGLITDIYSHQIRSSKHRNHPLPNYSKIELEQFARSSSTFHNLYSDWVESGFDRKLTPSFNRIENSEPYTLKNIEIITFDENQNKAWDDMRNARLSNKSNPPKPVVQYDKDLRFISDYDSVTIASKSTGIHQSNISKVLTGKRKTAGGCIWKYK